MLVPHAGQRLTSPQLAGTTPAGAAEVQPTLAMAATTVPGCFACHVDCATGCATDDLPFDHPDYADYKIPSFDETDADEADQRLREQSSDTNMSEKGVDKSAHGPVRC